MKDFLEREIYLNANIVYCTRQGSSQKLTFANVDEICTTDSGEECLKVTAHKYDWVSGKTFPKKVTLKNSSYIAILSEDGLDTHRKFRSQWK